IAKAGVFDRIAGNLSALGFMIDMLSVQPQLAKSLFVFDAEKGTLAPVMGRVGTDKPGKIEPAQVEPHLIEAAQLLAFSSVREDVPLQEVTLELERLSHEAQAADQPMLAAAVLKAQEAILCAADDPVKVTTARGELSEALVDFVATATEPAGLDMISEPSPLAPMKPIALVGDLEHDDEMREVFLEEAREVIEGAQAACEQLQHAPGDLNLLTTLRRAFHTLKGSGRMVGLKSFGDAAWACEQVFNTQLAEQRAAEPPLIEFATWVLGHLSTWVDDIAANRDGERNEGEVKLAADRVARRLATGVGSSDIALPFGLPPDLPSAADLRLGLPEMPAQAPQPATEVAFELDLSGFERADRAPGPIGDLPPLDVAASAMFDRFDESREEPEADPSRTTIVDAPFDMTSGPIDLDLGVATEAAPLIELLEPSDTASAATPDLLLDLSSVDALPDAARTAASRPMPLDPTEPEPAIDEHVKVVGSLRIGIPLFNIYLNEADELSRRLTTEVAEWAMELHRPLGETPIALAHSLAGSSATVGFTDLSHLARSLEHALARSQVIGHGTDEDARLFVNAAEEIRRLLHQFAAGVLKEPDPELLTRLAEHELTSALRLEAATAASELAGGVESESPADAALTVEPLMSLDLGDDSMADAAVATDEQLTTPAVLDEVVPAPADVAPPQPVEPAAEGTAPSPGEAAPEAVVAAAEPPVASQAPDRVEAPADAETQAPAEAEAEEAPASSTDEPAEAGMSAFGALAPYAALGLSELKPLAAAPTELLRPAHIVHASTFGDVDDDIDAVDAVDLELFPIFEEEALELLPKLAAQLRDWAKQPSVPAHANACMRTLHTLKGGARLAGAMRLGEMAHRLETRIERLTAGEAVVDAGDVEVLQGRSDAMAHAFDAMRNRDAQAYADAVAAAIAPPQGAAPPAASVPAPAIAAAPLIEAPAAKPVEPPVEATPPRAPVPPVEPEGKRSGKGRGRGGPPAPVAAPATAPAAAPAEAPSRSVPASVKSVTPAVLPEIDWSRFAASGGAAPARPAERPQVLAQSAVRVRAPLLDRLVNQAGEVSITRSRIESGVGQIKG
ncbi:MAG: Hpt domain-containing protein, partial [Caldimonas sp.]